MHSVHFESLCMYIVILVCIMYKTLTMFVVSLFFFFFSKKKNSPPRVMVTCGSHMAMCLNYTWPFGHAHWNTWPHGRV